MKFLPACLILLTACASAAEPVVLPLEVGTLTMRDGKVYEGVKVIGQDAVGVKISHAGGTARIPFEKLPKDLANRFPRDQAAAKEQLAKEAKAEAVHERSVDKAVAKQKAEDEAEDKSSPLEGVPDEKGDTPAKIASLEAYILRLEQGIVQTRMEVSEAHRRAQEYRNSAQTAVSQVDSQGNRTYVDTYNSSRAKRAEFQERKADREELKIKQAESLIGVARSKISLLEASLKDKK